MVGPAVVVLDGDQRAALAVVRSLGRRGCMLHVGAPVPHSIAGGSRFAASETLLPNPLNGSELYCDAVTRLARERNADIVLPVTEAATLALLEHPGRTSGIRIPTSDLAHFRHASDKEAVLALAQTLGISVPSQWTLSGKPGDGDGIPTERFPVVVKPARSVAGAEGSRRKVGVRYAHSPAMLQEILADFGPDAGPFLVQSRIEGPGVGIFLLRWNGRILARFAHRRVREKPPSGGVSVCCESVAPAPVLIEQSEALLAALDWNGVAMVEYKHDSRTGRNFLMEINPRFWGSLQLAIDSGVDFPWYLLQAAQGQPTEAAGQWRIGQRSRWCWGEVDHLITRLKNRPANLDLPADDPGFLRTALSIMIPWRPGQRSDVFQVSDPVPFWRESIAWVRAL